MLKMELAAIIGSSFLVADVFAGQLHFIKDVHGVENYLSCHQGYKPDASECGDYIEKPGHSCYTDATSDVFCRTPSHSAGNRGQEMKCIPKKCIVQNPNNPNCDRSKRTSDKSCRNFSNAAGVVKRDKVNFLVGNVENGTSHDFCHSDSRSADCYVLPSFRISCQSDKYEPNEDYGGAIVYDIGEYGKVERMKPGYVILKKIDAQSEAEYKTKLNTNSESWEGNVHGLTVHHRFKMNPSKLRDDYDMKIAGFAYREKTVKKIGFTSGTLNFQGGWKNKHKKMVEDERVLVTALINTWKQNGIAQTYWAMDEPALEDERKECRKKTVKDRNCRKALRSWKPKVSLIPFICKVLTGTAGLDISETLAIQYGLNWYSECMPEIQAQRTAGWPNTKK